MCYAIGGNGLAGKISTVSGEFKGRKYYLEIGCPQESVRMSMSGKGTLVNSSTGLW
jgi:hypothetical protein